MRDYVHHDYAADAAVAADMELQTFVVQVGQSAERNPTRPAYRYLRPSELPQSINI